MKKILTKIGLVLISVVIGLSPLFVAIPISAATLYEYDTYQDSNGLYNGAYNFWAQTFTPNSDHTISQVYLLVMAGADPTGTTTTVRITNTTEDLPSTTIYGNATFSNNGIGTSYPADFTWKVATFSSPVSITNGTKYAIVVSTDLEAGMYWGKDTGNHLLYGNAAYSVDGGSTWNTDTGNDMTFQIYGDPSPTITPTPSPTGTPPTVTTGMAFRESATSVSLYGSLDSLGTADNVTVGFNVGDDSSVEWYFDAYTPIRTWQGGFYITLTGLSTNTTYYYQAVGVGDGEDTGTIRSFYQSSVPLTTPTVITLPATAVGPAGATVNGNLTDMGGYPELYCSFQVKKFGESEWHPVYLYPLMHIKNETCTYDEDLWTGSNETWIFRAFATDGASIGEGQVFVHGEEFSFYTADVPPSVFTVTMLPLSSIHGKYLTATANVIGQDIANDTEVEVIFGYKPYSYGFEYLVTTDPVSRIGNGTLSKVLTGLIPLTKYQVIAYGIVKGTIIPSQWVYDTTLAADGTTPTPTLTPTGTPGPTITPTPTLTPTIPSVIDTLADLLGADLSTAGGQWFVTLALLVIIPLFLIAALHNIPSIAAILSIACDAIVLGWAIINWLDPWMIGLLAIIAGGIIWAVIKSFFSGRGGS